MRFLPPIIHDSLDRPNANANAQITPPKKDWRIYLVISTAILIALVIFIVITYSMYIHLAYTSAYEYGLKWLISTSVVWFVQLSPLIILISAIYHINRFLSVLTRRAELINVMDYQTTLSSLDKNVFQHFLNVMMKRADKSEFQGVQTLTYDNSQRVTQADELQKLLDEPLDDDDDEIIPIAQNNESVLVALRNENLINRSNNSILIGFGKKK